MLCGICKSTDPTQDTCPRDDAGYTVATWQHDLDPADQKCICPERSRSSSGNRSYRSCRSSVGGVKAFLNTADLHHHTAGHERSRSSATKKRALEDGTEGRVREPKRSNRSLSHPTKKARSNERISPSSIEVLRTPTESAELSTTTRHY